MTLTTLLTVLLLIGHAALTSLFLAFLSGSCGLLFSTCLIFLEQIHIPFLKSFLKILTLITQSVPVLLQLVIWDAIFKEILSPFTIALLSLTIYYATIARKSALNAIKEVPHEEVEAAQALGFTHFQIMQFIIIPQVIQKLLPNAARDIIELIKITTLTHIIGVQELTKIAYEFAVARHHPAIIYGLPVLFFIGVSLITTYCCNTYLSRRKRIC